LRVFLEFANFDSQTYSINSPPLRTICADAIISIRNVAKKRQTQYLNYTIKTGPTVLQYIRQSKVEVSGGGAPTLLRTS